MTDKPSHLERLPLEIAREVASNLDKKDIANLRCSRTTNAMFAPVSEVAKLLDFVKEEANYEEAAKMVGADPTLMFKYVSIKKKNLDGSYMMNADHTYVYETISTLKFA